MFRLSARAAPAEQEDVVTDQKQSFLERMIGAAKLDVGTYEEVEHDLDATAQAAGVVAIVAVCAAIGGASHGSGGIIGRPIAALIGWLIWSGVTYVIGTRLLGGTATWGEMLRTIGFAHAPGVLYLLAGLPLLGSLVGPAVGIWMLAAGVIAVRQALDFSTGKALLTVLLGWVASVAFGIAVAVLLGVPAAIFGGLTL